MRRVDNCVKNEKKKKQEVYKKRSNMKAFVRNHEIKK